MCGRVHEYGERDHGLKFFWPLERITADIVASSVLVYTVSKGVMAALFPAVPSDRLRSFRYSIAVPPANGSDRRLEFFRDNQSIKLGVFAALHPSKGQEDAVLAMAELVARGRNVELLLAGSGDQTYREKLVALGRKLNVAERIHFSGFLDDPYPAMRSCDIILVCSRNEGFGRVAVEAMLMEKAVVYAAAGGLLELMIDGQTGISYPPTNIARLVAGLEELISNPERRRSIERFSRPYAERDSVGGSSDGEIFRTLLGLRSRTAPKTFAPSLLAENMFTTIADEVTGRRRMSVAHDELHDHFQAETGQLRTSLEGVQARLEEVEADLALATSSLAERDHTISEQDAQIVRSTEALAERDRTISEKDATDCAIHGGACRARPHNFRGGRTDCAIHGGACRAGPHNFRARRADCAIHGGARRAGPHDFRTRRADCGIRREHCVDLRLDILADHCPFEICGQACTSHAPIAARPSAGDRSLFCRRSMSRVRGRLRGQGPSRRKEFFTNPRNFVLQSVQSH